MPDVRTWISHSRPSRPSVDLLDTVYAMQLRQDWMREYLIEEGAEPLGFVGAYSAGKHSPAEVADAMRDTLGLDGGWTDDMTRSHAISLLRDRMDDAGALVSVNGVVGNNNSRKLNPDEFHGFALVDEYAPLIFVNGADSVDARMFALISGLARVGVGESGVSRFDAAQPPRNKTELFCNRAAADFLTDGLYPNNGEPQGVSDATADQDDFFWDLQNWRIGRRFAAAVVRSVKEGRTSYLEAHSLTGLNGKAFDGLAERMDIPL